MREKVQVAVAGDVTEAEEMQAMLLAAGIEADIATQDGGFVVLVAEDDLTAAREALEALTEPDELIAEP